MDENTRRQKTWKLLCKAAGPWLRSKFAYTHDTMEPEGPFLVISNHVTNWDPLLLALSFPTRHIHFVASEHLFRLGKVSKLISYLVAPIPRRKGANGAATAIDSMRKMRAGNAVCIFGEGETTWDGVSSKVFPATGSLAKMSGATLITFRFEGGYLTMPRWGRGVRRGKMHGGIVNVYTPEQLKAMKPLEIEAAMNADIYEDAWARQKSNPVKFRGRNRAEGVEVAVFMCPKCGQVGTVRGKGNEVSCSCGMKCTVTEYGTFDPPVPFENMAQWNVWQHEKLLSGEFPHGEELFSDESAELVKISKDAQETAASGRLSMTQDAIAVGEVRFSLAGITDMALIQRKRLAFMHGEDYYEIRTPEPKCLRKYYAVWRNAAESGQKK